MSYIRPRTPESLFRLSFSPTSCPDLRIVPLQPSRFPQEKTKNKNPNLFIFFSLCFETIHETATLLSLAQYYPRAQQVLSEREVSNAWCLGWMWGGPRQILLKESSKHLTPS